MPGLALALLIAVWVRPGFVPDVFVAAPGSDFSDLTLSHWPNAVLAANSLRETGQIPLWRPQLMGGAPFAANPLSGLWYPPQWLLLLWPAAWAFNLLYLVHLAWGGLGMARLVQSLGARREAAALAGLAWLLTPRVIAHMGAGHVSLVLASSWLPWLFVVSGRLGTESNLRAGIQAGIVAALLFLADPRLAALALPPAAAWWLYGRLISPGFSLRSLKQLHLASLSGPASATIVFGMLIAPGALPLLEFMGQSTRAGLTPAESAVYSLPPSYLLGLALPDLGGFGEWMTYVGWGVLVLATIAVARTGRVRWFWLGLAALTAWIALGTNGVAYPALLAAVPPAGWLRVPARAFFLVALSLTVLAGLGADHLLAGVNRRTGRRWTWLAVAAAGISVAVFVQGLAGRASSGLMLAAVFAALSLAVVAGRATGRLGTHAFLGLMAGALVLDLGIMDLSLICLRPADDLIRPVEELGTALSEAAKGSPSADFFRIYAPGFNLPPLVGARDGIQSLEGVDPLQLSEASAVIRQATGTSRDGYNVTLPPIDDGAHPETALAQAHPDLNLLGLLNVRYLVARWPVQAPGLFEAGHVDGFTIFRNPAELPRAFVVQRVRGTVDLAQAFALLSQTGPAQVATVDDGPKLDGPPGITPATVLQYTPNSVTIRASGPGLLVLTDMFYPGWQVTVDGQMAEARRADGVFRGVFLPEGSHQVKWEYRPVTVFAGWGIGLAGWVFVALTWISRRVVRP